MNKDKYFYITTTLPYVNAKPHVGFAMEIVRADIIARYKKAQGFNVFFNTGTDEHGQKLYESAKQEGKDVQIFVAESAENFRNLLPILGISEDIHFIRTTDEKHIKTATEFWNHVNKNGFIYKKNTKQSIALDVRKKKPIQNL